MRSTLPWLVLPLVAVAAYLIGARTPVEPPHVATATARFSCSMHPQIVLPSAGKCPICGMDLTPAAAAETIDAGSGRIAITERARLRAQLRVTPVQRDSGGEAQLVLFGRIKQAGAAELWADAADVARLAVGKSAAIASNAFRGQMFAGTVRAVDPRIDPATNRAHVTVDLVDREHKLAPGAIVEATLGEALGPGNVPPLLVPASAVLFTGKRSLVYVLQAEMGMASYEARIVELGARSERDGGAYYQVRTGLGEGDRVVTNGAFVLDADAQLRGAVSMMAMDDDVPLGASAAQVALKRTQREPIVQAPVEYRTALRLIAESYLALARALASDALDQAKRAAATLANASRPVRPHAGTQFQSVWAPLGKRVDARALEIAEAPSLTDARLAFADLSQALVALLRTVGNPLGESVRVAHCPMAFAKRGADWLQLGVDIDNPYFGAEMVRCGSIVDTVTSGGYLRAASTTPGSGRSL